MGFCRERKSGIKPRFSNISDGYVYKSASQVKGKGRVSTVSVLQGGGRLAT